MNPSVLAAQYEETIARLRQQQGQLHEANLGRLENEYVAAIAGLERLVDALRAFR